jgi:hypothetical protein
MLLGLGLAGEARAWQEAAGKTIALQDYWELVSWSAELVEQQAGVPMLEAHAALGYAADRWEAVQAVRLPDGGNMPVEASALVAELRAVPPRLELLEERFAALLAAGEDWPQHVFGAADVALLAPILAQAEFQWVEKQPSPLKVWFEKQFNRLLEWLADLFNLEAALVGGRIFELVLIGLGLLAVLLVLGYATRGLWGALVPESVLDQESAPGDEDLSAESALKKAQSLSAGGDLRQAVRYLYLSSLLTLEERGLLRYDRSKTNRETLRAIADQPELRSEMQEVVEVFDRVWYGFQALEQEDYDQYQGHVVRLRQQK